MAKSGYKKFKKQEKAKVKLKGNKTLLPKGLNVTDTAFKVKKIIVREQLKEHGEDELLTRKHLSVKELLSRLSHHNASMRQEAVTGLRELLTIHGPDVVKPNLANLLQASMALTVDRESNVRTDVLKLLSTLFEKVTEKELSPLFRTVVCHLTCAMTHIEPGVRGDSLRLLDAMLAALPGLTVTHAATLLPHCLDLISQRDGATQARTLSLNLDGRVTSEKWRARVIGRLNRLFSTIVDHSRKDSTVQTPSMEWTIDRHVYVGLYSSLLTSPKNLEDVSNLPMQEYAEMLMPLLLDSFTEAVPNQNQEDSQTACVVSVDTAALLLSVVEVILHIWNLLKQSPQHESLTGWFRKKWGEQVTGRLVQGRFPYSVVAANSRKRQRESDQKLVALQLTRDPELACSLLNTNLCLLVFLFSAPGDLWDQSVQYVKRRLRGGRSLGGEESLLLAECLQAASASSSSLLGVLASCDILTTTDKPVNKKAFDFLTSVALAPSHHLHQDKHFTTWLDSLPALLCRPTVPLVTVRSIANIAARNLPAFNQSLDGWAEEIIGNLAIMTVSGDRNGEGKRLISGLVYWVQDWDPELCLAVSRVVQGGSLGPELTSHLLDVIRFKAENTENDELKNMLEGILST